MLRFVSDENFNNDIVRGLLRRNPNLDIVRIQDVGLRGEEDPVILEWAANEERILLTHDAATMTNFAYERVRAELPMPGVIVVPDDLPIGTSIEDILLIAEFSNTNELENRIVYLPL